MTSELASNARIRSLQHLENSVNTFEQELEDGVAKNWKRVAASNRKSWANKGVPITGGLEWESAPNNVAVGPKVFLKSVRKFEKNNSISITGFLNFV